MILSPNSTWFVVDVDLLYKRLYGTVILSTVNAQMMWSVARSRCDSCMLELYIANLIDSALLPNGCCFFHDVMLYFAIFTYIILSVCFNYYHSVTSRAISLIFYLSQKKYAMDAIKPRLQHTNRTELNKLTQLHQALIGHAHSSASQHIDLFRADWL